MSGTTHARANDTNDEQTDADRRALLEAVAELDCQSAENAERMLQSFDAEEDPDS